MSTDAFISRLESLHRLSEDDRCAIRSTAWTCDVVWPGVEVIRQGDKPSTVSLIADGFAFRYKLLDRGRRQILGFLAPGDICDVNVTVPHTMDHDITTLSAATIVRIEREDMDMLLSRPAIARGLLMISMVAEAINRAWLTNIGQRRSDAKLAHLFCEWHARLATIGIGDGNECVFPVTQADLADALGMSKVHLNRALRSLNERGMVIFKQRRLHILDREALEKLSGFQPEYLYLQNEGST